MWFCLIHTDSSACFGDVPRLAIQMRWVVGENATACRCASQFTMCYRWHETRAQPLRISLQCSALQLVSIICEDTPGLCIVRQGILQIIAALPNRDNRRRKAVRRGQWSRKAGIASFAVVLTCVICLTKPCWCSKASSRSAGLTRNGWEMMEGVGK